MTTEDFICALLGARPSSAESCAGDGLLPTLV